MPGQAGRQFRVLGYRFEHQPNGRWGVAKDGLGVENSRTPIGALIALRRWRREYERSRRGEP